MAKVRVVKKKAKAGKLPVSVIVLTQDEARNLPGCLASLSWAAQVVVVDSGSTDKSVAIARAAGAEVHVNPWPGYTAQRNFALAKCRQPWVLSVDADERVAEDLRQAIIATLAQGPRFDGYDVPEVNEYFGRWLRHAGIYPGPHMVFYRRKGARYQSGEADVHEGVRVAAKGRLAGHLVHHAYPDITLALDKLNGYTSVEARGRLAKGARVGAYGLLWRPFERFVKNYLFKGGFMDGAQGLLYCTLTGYYTFVFNLKIWEATRRRGR